MTARSADIVIIGGAAIGSAIAYFLRRGGFRGRVAVVEKDPSYQWCASGRAVAGIRQQFSTPENIRLSQFGIGFFKGIRSEFGEDADIAFRERGYLVMATPEGRPTLEAIVQVSPFFHGVSLLQMAAWNQFSPARIAYHLGILILFSVVLGSWALIRIRRRLIS